MPALLTRMSIAPTFFAMDSTDVQSLTSIRISGSDAISAVITSTPSARRRRAHASPRPLAPPVTIAFFLLISVPSAAGFHRLDRDAKSSRRRLAPEPPGLHGLVQPKEPTRESGAPIMRRIV